MKQDYRFRINSSFRENVIRIATFLNQEFCRQLTYKSNVHESIHHARLCMKRQRALLRLIRQCIGEEVYRMENAFHRDTARKLAFLRDYSGSLDAVQALRKNRRSEYLDRNLDKLFNRVYNLRSGVLSHTDTSTLFGELIREMQMAKPRILTWDLSKKEEEIISKGVFRLYRQGQKRFRDALAEPGEHTFHQLRKSTKYLFFFHQMLIDLWPAMMKTQENETKQLSSVLGVHHDIYVLESEFDRMIPPKADRQYRSRLRQAIWKRKKKLESQILEDAARIYSELPGNYADRVKALWLLADRSR